MAGLLTLLAASWAADPPGRLSSDITRLVADLSNVVSTTFQVWYEVLILWGAVLLVCALVRRQFVLTIAMVSAGVLALFVAYGSHRFAVNDRIELGYFARLFTTSDSPAEYPGVLLVAALGGVDRRIACRLATVPFLRTSETQRRNMHA